MNRRNVPLLAFLAGLVWAGGGQAYNRQFAKGVVFWIVFWAAFVKVGLFAFTIALAAAVEALLVALADDTDDD